MRNELSRGLQALGFPESETAYLLAVLAVIAVASLVIHFVLHRIILQFVDRKVPSAGRAAAPEAAADADRSWWVILFSYSIFTRLSLMLQGVVVYTLARVFLDVESGLMQFIEVITQLWMVLFGLLSVFSVIDALVDMGQRVPSAKRLPLRGISQGVKLLATIVAVILAIALLIGKSPLILLSGLGAMTAILLLIFKDPVLGLVAGIQLSANDMLQVNDWLEMPQYGANGDVIDISLTTVKVRNWDQTITSIPNYALISDSFKNWRNIKKVHGRRIKRAVHIDATSVHFSTEEELKRLRHAELLSDYIESKVAEIEAYNREHAIDRSSPVNGRRLTNLGVFLAYLVAHIEANKNINHDLTYMVRQLDPGPNGIPLEICCFANDIRWVWYEEIQSDMFDHIFAVMPEFGLRVHQTPTGHDLRELGEKMVIGQGTAPSSGNASSIQ